MFWIRSIMKKPVGPRVIKFVVYPGFLPSKDGSPPVFYSYDKLLSLYGIDPLLCVDARDFAPVRKAGRSIRGPMFTRILSPQEDGDYSLERSNRSRIIS